MREEVLARVMNEIRGDALFRDAMLTDPEAALMNRGYDLLPDEMEAVERFRDGLAGLAPDGMATRLSEEGS